MRSAVSKLIAGLLAVATPSLAHAEISLSGDARMGIIRDYAFFFGPEPTVEFTSRARVRIDMSGETDQGLSFGARIRMDEAFLAVPDGERNWVAGRVYVQGSFGTLSMGDTDSAAEVAVGSVSAISLTGLGDNHETTYLQSSVGVALGPSVLYEYYGSGWAAFASATNNSPECLFCSRKSQILSVGARYSTGGLTLSAGIERQDTDDTPALQNVTIGAAYKFGDFTTKAVYGQIDTYYFDLGVFDYRVYTGDHWYISTDWENGPWVVSAFYAHQPDGSPTSENSRYYGIGAAYDLGGGAALTGGLVHEDQPDGLFNIDQTVYDLGITMSF